MICSNCNKYLLLLNFEEYIVSNMPISSEIMEEIFDSCVEIAEKDFICEVCGNTILKGESYIADDEYFKDVIFEFMGKQVMNLIDSCEECGQGADIQGLYPSIKSCYYDKDDDPKAIFESFNTASTIEDIMNDMFYDRAESWEPFYEQIVEYVSCPKCDNGSGVDYDEKIDHGEFDVYTEVYTRKDINLFNHNFYGDDLEHIRKDISELASLFSLEELVKLKNTYLVNKTFVAQNPIFYKLECFIKSLFKRQMFYVLSPNRIIFRTRTSLLEKVLSKDELWEPPYDKACHGRYNDIGVSLLYCANNINIIKKEVTLPPDNVYNIAKFITYKPFKLFPVNYIFEGRYSGLIDEEIPIENQNSIFKEQYILSNIVSAICLQVGFDGIVYRSTKDNFSIDYALFSTYEKEKDLVALSVEVSYGMKHPD